MSVAEVDIRGRMADDTNIPIVPWGALAPRGTSALCISAVVFFRIPRRGFIGCRLYRLLERRGPYFDFEEQGRAVARPR